MHMFQRYIPSRPILSINFNAVYRIDDLAKASALPQRLLEQYNTWVPTFLLQGSAYVRVSAQIYLEVSVSCVPIINGNRSRKSSHLYHLYNFLTLPRCSPPPSPLNFIPQDMIRSPFFPTTGFYLACAGNFNTAEMIG